MFVIKLNYKLISILLLIMLILPILIISINHYTFATVNISNKEGTIRLPIIMYHEVKISKWGKDAISPDEFESDLKYIKENNYESITMQQLIDYVYNDAELPEKPIMLTFDDGYFNTYKYVFPLLKEYETKAVLSIIGKSVDDFSEKLDDNTNYAHAKWSQIKEMSDSGLVEIQNHTYNLHSNKGRNGCAKKWNESLEKYEEILTEDLTKLQDKITQNLGKTPTTFVYPYGKSSKQSNEILAKMGFKASLLCGGKINFISKNSDDLFGLKRICRSHGKGIQKFI